jgi:hypothetical protein
MTSQSFSSPVDNLVAGDFKQITKTVTLKGGSNYSRGEILEINTTSGNAEKLATTTEAKFVLVNSVDATGGDTDALVFTTGQFHLDECVFNNALAADEIIETLHLRSIFLK